MVDFFLTGTCTNCMSRFRLSAREVLNKTNITCPHCGCDYNEEGVFKIKLMAKEVLERLDENGKKL